MKNGISFIIMDSKNCILLIMLHCMSSKLCHFYPNPNPFEIHKHCVGFYPSSSSKHDDGGLGARIIGDLASFILFYFKW